MKNILLLHGANLNWLGKRDPTHYGTLSLNNIVELTSQAASTFHYNIIAYQSNHEGCLIDTLQLNATSCEGIIINPGAFTHYSYALHDALLDTGLPVVEVHLSVLNQREKWRRKSVTAAACIKVIWGKKEEGYREAVNVLVEHIKNDK
jgi:3-dehydroquinate dehydratase-2